MALYWVYFKYPSATRHHVWTLGELAPVGIKTLFCFFSDDHTEAPMETHEALEYIQSFA
jgi:hypothetical protein